MRLEEHKIEFDKQGYTLVKNFIPAATAHKLNHIAKTDRTMAENSRAVLDSDGRESKLTLWYNPGDDVFGRLSCSDKLLSYMAHFLGGDVSFFHAKLMNKEAKTGGKWEWHQDYGYWYQDGFLKADMGSCFVALDACTKDNGALRVIPSSHTYGRLEHGIIGQQAGAEIEKVEAIKSRHGTYLCVMQPGDALFFHANTLHTSGPNLSDHSRLIMISSFFRRDNEAIIDDPKYRNKSTPHYSHDSLLDGAHGLDASVEFSDDRAHIMDAS